MTDSNELQFDGRDLGGVNGRAVLVLLEGSAPHTPRHQKQQKTQSPPGDRFVLLLLLPLLLLVLLLLFFLLVTPLHTVKSRTT